VSGQAKAGAWKARTGQKIETLYAWVASEPDGGEGLAGFLGPEGWMPLIGADLARIESLRHVAEDVARVTGYPVALKSFSTVTVIETLGKNGRGKT